MTVRYSWPTFSAPLRCELYDVRIDGNAPPDDLVDLDHMRLRLDRIPAWEQFRCDVTVGSDETSPIPEAETTGYLLASCPSANTRIPFPLIRRDGALHASVTVNRSTVSGSFTMRAELGATIAGRPRLIGRSDPWNAILEQREAPVPPGSPPFDISWVDFDSDAAPTIARANRSSLAVMDVSAKPQLFLNSSIAGLQELLYNDHARAERHRLRDILNASISRHVTITLLRAAVSEMEMYDEGPPRPPSTVLFRQTCEAVAHAMPGLGDVDELFEKIAYGADDPIASIELWTRADLAIDFLVDMTRASSSAAEVVARG